MEVVSTPHHGSLKRYWRRRQYHRLDGATGNKKNVRVTRFGGKARRAWKIKAIPKLRLKILSPLKLWGKLKDAYINMMLSVAGNNGALNNPNTFGARRIPKARKVPVVYSKDEFDGRLVYEIYKVLAASREIESAQKES